MKIYKNFNIGNKFKYSAIAIGNFDGFHLSNKKRKANSKTKKTQIWTSGFSAFASDVF